MPVQFKFFDESSINHEALQQLDGLSYRRDLISQIEEEPIVARVSELPFQEFDFHGYKGKRRVVSFGWSYEFAGGGQLRKADEIPDFLLPLRASAASFAQREPHYFQHVLVSEYGPGSGIGWHRDKSVFGEVVGVSLLSACILRFRRAIDASYGPHRTHRRSWDRVNLFAEPRSVYLLTGPSRSEWEHSILRVDSLRYSITFRHLL